MPCHFAQVVTHLIAAIKAIRTEIDVYLVSERSVSGVGGSRPLWHPGAAAPLRNEAQLPASRALHMHSFDLPSPVH